MQPNQIIGDLSDIVAASTSDQPMPMRQAPAPLLI